MKAPTLFASRNALHPDGAARPRGGLPAVRRRSLLIAAAPLALAACGFQLRQAPNFAFTSIYVAAATGSQLAADLRRELGYSSNLQVVGAAAAPTSAQVILEIVGDQREKVVVGLNASGQVREFQLRTRVKFRVRTAQGKELIPETELLQQRDISFSETVALAKEAEEQLLYRDMQADIVQQLMRRLAAVKSL